MRPCGAAAVAQHSSPGMVCASRASEGTLLALLCAFTAETSAARVMLPSEGRGDGHRRGHRVERLTAEAPSGAAVARPAPRGTADGADAPRRHRVGGGRAPVGGGRDPHGPASWQVIASESQGDSEISRTASGRTSQGV